ncbi:MAG: ABC transporter permease [Eubacteriales bacterium]|jgi:multidrug/hemolysin transport system permease protein|nr:ABC transporter permease [Eubacteriales bacterium]
MINFTKRNLLVFFKDKASVFFSLLSVFIIIGMYALFLGDVWTSSMSDIPGARTIMDSWIVAGLIAVTSVTTTMGAFGAMVEDKTKKIIKDIHSSPLPRASIAGGYILSAFIIGVIMCIIALVLCQLYLLSGGGALFTGMQLLKIFGLILISTFSNTAMMLFFVSFFQSINAFSIASTVIGTIIGFMTGIYIPIGQLPEGVQWVIKLFPPSHSALMLRQVIMEDPIKVGFAGAPAEVVDGFKEMLGVMFKVGETTVTPIMSIGLLTVSGILFLGLAMLSLSRKKR